MKVGPLFRGGIVGLVGALLAVSAALAQSDPLPSWNDSANKQAILAFVEAVTAEGGADYVAPQDRIATFDNDGTLWIEHPMYTQLAFALDRVKALAPEHPDWKNTPPSRLCSTTTWKPLARLDKRD